MRTKASRLVGRVLLLLATLVVMGVAASTAQAAFHQRWVATSCSSGRVLVERYIDHYRVLSNYGCPSHTVYVNGKFYTWTRAALDIQVADDYAHRWWGHCEISWSGVDDSHYSASNNASWYFTRFDLRCP